MIDINKTSVVLGRVLCNTAVCVDYTFMSKFERSGILLITEFAVI
jgi:hypothetical protein